MTHKANLIAIVLTATLAALAQSAPPASAVAGQPDIHEAVTAVSFSGNGQQLNDMVGRGVAVADFNGDGALDAFVVNESGPTSQECRVYLGDGSGRFEDSAQRLTSRSWARRPVVHDVDGNGTKDVIVGRMMWVNEGEGKFVAGASPLADSDSAMVWQCRLEDLNGDGRTDLFAIVTTANMESKGRIYLNDGKGRFQEVGQTALPGIAAFVELGDVNGDGTTDAVVSGWRNAAADDCPNRVLINDGQGRFTDSGQQLDEEMRHSHGLALGDLDRDGDVDLVLATQGTPSARLYLNDGKGGFTAGQTLGTSGVEKVGLADLEGDGSPDIYLACIGPDEVWLNDGRASFADATLRLGRDWSWEIAFGDFNRDGLPDVFVVNLGIDRAAPPEAMMKPRQAEVWLNTSAAPRTIGVASVTVPQGNGVPVITDGIFTPGEWDDAQRVAVADSVTLHIKEYRGVVFIGVRGQGPNGIGPSELSLAVPNGAIQKLHRSFALWEVVLPQEGAEPKPRVGFTADWYANELRRDEAEFERLQKEGRSPIEVMQATTYPADGMEFAIRRSKLPGRIWLLRLSASAFAGGKPGMVTYPPAAAEKATDSWLELRFE